MLPGYQYRNAVKSVKQLVVANQQRFWRWRCLSPGDEITNEEIEVALSTQIFNNRVLLNGNLGYGRNQMAASNIIGDFDVEVKAQQ